ncbi:MAG: hypothetical protein ABH873_05940 [Candidatus Firestonebacteria bacterium]
MHKIVSFALKIPEPTIKKVRGFCKEHGTKIGFFIDSAITEKIEREELFEDSKDISQLRYEEGLAIPLEKYFEKRNI